MIGLFQELGPCGVDSNGNAYNNPYSWSNASNMVNSKSINTITLPALHLTSNHSSSSTNQPQSDFRTRFQSQGIKIALVTSSNYPVKHAPTTPKKLAHAAHTPNQTLVSFQTQLKARHRICGRHCRASWVHSRSTHAMASPSRRRATAATTVRCLTVRITHNSHSIPVELDTN